MAELKSQSLNFVFFAFIFLQFLLFWAAKCLGWGSPGWLQWKVCSDIPVWKFFGELISPFTYKNICSHFLSTKLTVSRTVFYSLILLLIWKGKSQPSVHETARFSFFSWSLHIEIKLQRNSCWQRTSIILHSSPEGIAMGSSIALECLHH